MTAEPHIMLVAGEHSGDALGGELMIALRGLLPDGVRFSGVGGPAMEAQGLHSLFPMSDIAVMGIGAVVPRIPTLLSRIRETATAAVAGNPDILVVIDSPDFTHRVAKRVARLAPHIPVVDYVAPQVWAWRKGRAKKMARYFTHVLALLPFEPAFFEASGLPCTFVGHPVVNRVPPEGAGQAFRAAHNVPPDAKLLCLLPGSRGAEVHRLLEPFGATADLLAALIPGLRVVVPTVPHLREEIEEAAANWSAEVVVVGPDEKPGAFGAADAALAASGTVSLELAVAGIPMVIGYKVDALTAFAFKRLVRVPSIVLANLVLGENLIPEYLQTDCTPERLSAELYRLLEDPEARARQVDAIARVAAALGINDEPPSIRAARTVLSVMSERSRLLTAAEAKSGA